MMFLKEDDGRKSRVSDEIKPKLMVDGALPIEKFDRTFFYNMAFREKSDIINRVSITLEVETAHARLQVSEDRKRVRLTGTLRRLPDTGKRFPRTFPELEPLSYRERTGKSERELKPTLLSSAPVRRSSG